MAKTIIDEEQGAEQLINEFLERYSSLVSRFLTSSLRTRAILAPAPPSASFPKPVGSNARIMGRKVNGAKPHMTADEDAVDFATESAVLLLRLRSLLEKHLNQDGQTPVLPSAGTTTGNPDREKQLAGKRHCVNGHCVAPPSRRASQQVHPPFPTTAAAGEAKDVDATRHITGAADAKFQAQTARFSMGCQCPSLSQGTTPKCEGGDSFLHIAHGRLTFALQRHTGESILSLDSALNESEMGLSRIGERALRIQTGYVDGIARELKREQGRLDEKQRDGHVLNIQEKLYYREIMEVLERLEMALAEVNYTTVVEEVSEGGESGGAGGRRASSGDSNGNDLASVFGRGGAGFVSRLVVQNVQCFLSVLVCTSNSPHRWGYLDKVLFLTDSESPVPTVPVEMNGTPSRGSTDMCLEKTLSRERSTSVKTNDRIEEWAEVRSTNSPRQACEQKLRQLVVKFRPCHAYEKVQRYCIPFDVKGVW
ncbi:hypothetical protein DQ04_00731130 [Trypanosoma grayi]|uniref:hypothetical protein n=1 Tax=Trypanosoma grayi TaxID=71804 RepID=UPI0004F42AB2|nr:hypothetical protein DQ04_00731130 [Trypanosoma grayi]KEG13891.1 hypothetical protein DQ04_00731130 [Trypanosoma grayi]